MGSDEQLDVKDLVGDEDLEFLKEIAAKSGVSIGEIAKEGIQEIITKRTRPRPMPGTIQAFRR